MSTQTLDTSYTDHGGSGDVVILLHGFLSSSRYWDRVVPMLLSSGFHVVTIDLLGFGDAPKPKHSQYDYDAHTAHVSDVVKLLTINEPFVLIGHSMGALVASHFAKEYPGMIASLVLLHPPLYRDVLDAQKTLRKTGRLYRFLLDSKYRRVGWAFFKMTLRYQLGRHTYYSREKSLRNVIEATEIFGELEQTNVDTLLLVGMRDRPEYTQNLHAMTLSNHVVVVEENVTHHSPVKNPLLVHEMIWNFLNVPAK